MSAVRSTKIFFILLYLLGFFSVHARINISFSRILCKNTIWGKKLQREFWEIPSSGKREKMPRSRTLKEGFSVGIRGFEKMVKEALETIPRELKDQLENVAFMVEDEPSDLPDEWGEEDPDLLGLYHGVSRKDRGFWYGNTLPDRILIYRRPLERISASLEELRENIRQTVVHEVGHYFGFDEEELRELEEEVFRSPHDDGA
jgi:predicted Zn-dependent protease with MMP-like domain